MPLLYSHLYRVVQDIAGNVVPDVMGTITVSATGALAELYADAEGLTPLPNPLTNNPQYASFSVYLDAGHYNMTFLKAGYVFEDLNDIMVAEASGGVTALFGTPNRILVSASTGDITVSAPQNLDPDASLQFAHLGLGTPAEAPYALTVATPSVFRAPMTAVDINSSGQVTANSHYTPDHPGDTQVAFHSHLNEAGGTNRWVLYGGGTAPSYLAGRLQVGGAVTFSSTMNVGSNAVVGGSFQVNGTLTVLSTAQVNGAVGFGGAPVGGYYITTYGSSQLAANVTIGMVGTAATAQLDVNGSVRSRGYLTADSGATITGTITTNYLNASNNVSATYVGAGGAPDARFSLRSYGTSYCDGYVGIAAIPRWHLEVGGHAYISASLGLWGSVPDGGHALLCGGPARFYTTGVFHGKVGIESEVNNSYSLILGGACYMAGALSVAGALSAGALSASSLYSASTIYSAGATTVASTLTVYGLTYHAANVGFGTSTPDAPIDMGAATGTRILLYNDDGPPPNMLRVGFATEYLALRVFVQPSAVMDFGVMDGNGGFVTQMRFEPSTQRLGIGVFPSYGLQVSSNAGIPGGQWINTASSRQLKQKIRPLTGALAVLAQLQPRLWEWADEERALAAVLPGEQAGFVAEEVQAVIPAWSPLDATGRVGLAMRGLDAYLVAALHEVMARLEVLEAGKEA